MDKVGSQEEDGSLIKLSPKPLRDQEVSTYFPNPGFSFYAVDLNAPRVKTLNFHYNNHLWSYLFI